jgi:hypothetical protein
MRQKLKHRSGWLRRAHKGLGNDKTVFHSANSAHPLFKKTQPKQKKAEVSTVCWDFTREGWLGVRDDFRNWAVTAA